MLVELRIAFCFAVCVTISGDEKGHYWLEDFLKNPQACIRPLGNVVYLNSWKGRRRAFQA